MRHIRIKFMLFFPSEKSRTTNGAHPNDKKKGTSELNSNFFDFWLKIW